jgi:hypothetical protein
LGGPQLECVEKLAWGEDDDALEAIEGLQVSVAGDQISCFTGDGCGENQIVFLVRSDAMN